MSYAKSAATDVRWQTSSPHAFTDSPFVTTVEGKNLAPPSHAHSLNQDHTLPLKPPGINIVVSEKKDGQNKIKNVLVAVDGIHFTILKPGGSGGMLGALERQCESGARFFPSTVWRRKRTFRLSN